MADFPMARGAHRSTRKGSAVWLVRGLIVLGATLVVGGVAAAFFGAEYGYNHAMATGQCDTGSGPNAGTVCYIPHTPLLETVGGYAAEAGVIMLVIVLGLAGLIAKFGGRSLRQYF